VSPEAEQALLDLFLIEKAAYEIRYEAANRPTWLSLPVRGLAALTSRLLGDTGTPPQHDSSTQAPRAATPPNAAEGDHE
jgi:maltose alpha-D-glucosyltransferase/alpha-amylase